ncbi:MAG TPA: ornithine cyclodeaminase family protein [Stellaceae bacterium]|nr:ornithine cyclodeaminase family protein [Stellaceae bacterium]
MRSQPPQTMRLLGPSEVMGALDFTGTIETLRQMFRAGAEAPVRHHHTVPVPGAPDATLLLMPAWQVGRHIGVKLATVFPGNAATSMPSVMGAYLLLDGKTGQPLALMDGPALTARRTAAASALAAIYLARPDASRLLMVGTGALAPQLVEAHASVRPIKQVVIWGRNPDKAQRLAHRLSRRNLAVSATDDLANAVHGADIVSCATLSKEPLIKGHWLKLGAHVDLVGGFTPAMREADDEVIRRARVFVDTREGALKEAGDIVQPLRSGVLAEDDIAGDLFDLTRGSRAGRRYYDQITLFKSVGTALEDLAAAQLAFKRATT